MNQAPVIRNQHGVASRNQHRISAKQVLTDAGCDSLADFLDNLDDSIAPACCDEGCQVEHDGTCPHGCPSVLRAMGMI